MVSSTIYGMRELTLAEAAAELGLSPTTLRGQVRNGRLHARLVGKTYVVADDEVERYRMQSRGRAGRPRGGGSPSSRLGRSRSIVDPVRLASLADLYGIRSLSLFGSVARGDDGPASDVDIVMELEPHSTVGLFEHARIADELGRLFGRRVDLVTRTSLRPRMRESVEREAVSLFSR